MALATFLQRLFGKRSEPVLEPALFLEPPLQEVILPNIQPVAGFLQQVNWKNARSYRRPEWARRNASQNQQKPVASLALNSFLASMNWKNHCEEEATEDYSQPQQGIVFNQAPTSSTPAGGFESMFAGAAWE